MKAIGYEKVWLLRWAFTYSCGKTVAGVWMAHEEGDPRTLASRQDLTNMVEAKIQGRRMGTNEVIDLVSLPKAFYKSFEWRAGIATALGAKTLQGGDIIGLALCGWHSKLAIYIDGGMDFSGSGSESIYKIQPPVRR